jgi:uncharacterized SAM-binding protein YcdF (DUF218 family)
LFYLVSKVFWALAAPTNALIFIATGSSLWALWSRSAKAARISAASALALLAIGFSPVSIWLTVPLENRFPQWQDGPQLPPYGIIILGGAVDVRISEARHYPLKLYDSGERITSLIELARRYPMAKLVFTGIGEPISEGEEVAKKIAVLGVDPGRLILETRSRNTFENAQFSARLLKPEQNQRWLLVTSAWHMPRAIGCFRQAGFRVEAYPVDFRTADSSDLFLTMTSATDGLRQTDFAAKEWVGLLVYWLSGKTNALLPRPED